MSEFVARVGDLIRADKVRISKHGYDELVENWLTAREVPVGILEAVVIEEYMNDPKRPCLLLLQKARMGNPIHLVWGVPEGRDKPVVLVTAYRPDPERWDETFMPRRQ